jgi:glycosyltransferase involved in cell wall biosynthesis
LRTTARAPRLEGAVTFAGAVPNDELAPRYRRAALLVVPSVVAKDGDQEGAPTGFRTAGPASWPAGAMRTTPPRRLRVLLDPRHARALAHRGRSLVLERFNWQKVGKGYEDLLCTAADARPEEAALA